MFAGWMPIHVAASNGHEDALKLLLTHQKTKNKVFVCSGPQSKYYKGEELLEKVVSECGLHWNH
jgi:hypothetical protein